jgi:hypothetical protein
MRHLPRRHPLRRLARESTPACPIIVTAPDPPWEAASGARSRVPVQNIEPELRCAEILRAFGRLHRAGAAAGEPSSMKNKLIAALAVLIVPALAYVGASLPLGMYQWQRDHQRCAGDSACLDRREHQRYGLFHAWGSNVQAGD